MKARYFTYFSYIGTRFRSSQEKWSIGKNNIPDLQSVQGLMEQGLLKLKSVNYPRVSLSSRTDKGVHALNTGAHFDLVRRIPKIYEPEKICYQLNKFFHLNNISICIKKCLRVPDNFNARFNASHRVYLYRLAVLKEGTVLPENSCLVQCVPVEEWRRCHFIRRPGFNIERFREGAKYFEGFHDFTTFKKFHKDQELKHNRRRIYSVEVRPGRPMISSYTQGQSDDIFDYWDVEIKGKSFVHNQIRRMIGTLISVAVGKLEPEHIKVMLQVPSKHSWFSFLESVPSHGLYLCNVHYDPKDLIYETEEINNAIEDHLNVESVCEL